MSKQTKSKKKKKKMKNANVINKTCAKIRGRGIIQPRCFLSFLS